jgi:LacI family transcriptional regulator
MLAISDVEVAKALRFVREHACQGIQVSDVIAQTKHSPSTLERRIKALFGRSLKSEITRVKVDSAKLLLQETNLKISQIAARTGFSEPKYFSEVFRSVQGVTPTTYRKQFLE